MTARVACGVVWAAWATWAAAATTRPAGGAGAATGPTSFETGWGAEYRRVLATPEAQDDAALAERLLKASAAAGVGEDLAAELCEKAAALASKAPEAYETAIRALRRLGSLRPGRGEACWKQILGILRRRFSQTEKFAKLETGERILVEALHRVEQLRAGLRFVEAAGVIREVLPTARYIRSPRYGVLLEVQKFLLGRGRVAAQVRAAEKRLQAGPEDVDARQQLIRLFLAELDRPDLAAGLVTDACDEVTRTYVPLAARPVGELDPAACAELGLWYKAVLSKASREGRIALLGRTRRYLRRALAQPAADGPQGQSLRQAARDVEAAWRLVAGRYPLRPADLPADPKWLAHGRARNRLPIKAQVAMVKADLAATHGGKQPSVYITPHTSRPEIHSVSYSEYGRAVSRLDALTALPLRKLSLVGCKGLRGDLRALAGMPLENLDLSDCGGLESLHGLEGAPLKRLDLSSCTGLRDISALAEMDLVHLSISAGPHTQDANFLRPLPLTSVSLGAFRRLRDLTVLRDKALTALTVNLCGLRSLRGIEGMKLREAKLIACPELTDIAPLRGMPLTSLSLKGCTGLKGDLAALSEARLTQLDLTGCGGLTSLAGIAGQPITTLELDDCNSLRSLRELAGMPLESLDISGCTALPDDLTVLRGRPLASLDISGCTQLTSLAGLEGLPLTSLDAGGCTGLVGDLRALARSRLTDLNLAGCGALESLHGIERLPIKALNLHGCAKLTAADYALVARIPTLREFTPYSKQLGAVVFRAMAERRARKKSGRQ